MSDKKYKTEWKFSFEKLGDSLNRMVSSVTDSVDEEVKMASFSEPIGETTSATIDLDLSVGETTVKALAGSDNLIEADITHLGEIEFATTGGTDKAITLRQKSRRGISQTFRQAIGSLSKRRDLRWDVRLSPDVPLKLDVDGGVGPAHIDLTGLNITDVEFEGGVGETHLTLPASSAAYSANIEGGVGSLVINLPANTSINFKIEGGVGSVKLNVPEGAAMRAAVDGNLGGVKMPPEFNKVASEDEFATKGGVWETPGFDEAEHKITIDYEGGVGSLQVISAAETV